MFCGLKYALSISTSTVCVVDFGVLPAHDARQRNGLGFVGDQQHLVRQRAFLAVERLEFFALRRAADDDGRAIAVRCPWQSNDNRTRATAGRFPASQNS